MKLLTWDFYVSTIIQHTSNALVSEKMSPLTEGKFLQFIGLLFFMATVSSFLRSDYWSTKDFDERRNSGPFNFFTLMSKQRFDIINHKLCFTSKTASNYTNQIWEVFKMIQEWNKQMASVFCPSWILCLDKSMSIWHRMFTCSGWEFCPRKPRPFSNEYHTVCCAKSGILTQIELVEGNDCPKEIKAPKYNNKGKTVGLLI